MRLYFHLVGDAGALWDRTGIEVADVGRALAEALRAVEEIRQQGPTAAEAWWGWTLNITDASGWTRLLVELGCPIQGSWSATTRTLNGGHH